MDSALHFYECAQDYLSLVRVHCYMGNIHKVTENWGCYVTFLIFNGEELYLLIFILVSAHEKCAFFQT